MPKQAKEDAKPKVSAAKKTTKEAAPKTATKPAAKKEVSKTTAKAVKSPAKASENSKAAKTPVKTAKKQEVKAAKPQKVRAQSSGDMKTILDEIRAKITKIDNRKHPAAHFVASDLMNDLDIAHDHYERFLKIPGVESWHAAAAFKKDCKTAIYTAHSVLERELGWGQHLTDTLHSLTDAVIREPAHSQSGHIHSSECNHADVESKVAKESKAVKAGKK